MQATFIGEFPVTLDPKNRLFVPPRFREPLAKEGKSHFVITSGLEGNLWAFLPSEWERALERITVPITKRYLMGKAQEIEVDSQGRILVPQVLKQEAGLSKDALVVGAGTKFEIWDASRHAAWDKKIRAQAKEGLKNLDI